MPLDLFPYQEEGAGFLASRYRAGLHDEMGVGKTAQAIRALDMLGARRGIIVCPAMLRENWIREFKRFSFVHRYYAKGENIHDYVAWSRRRFDVLITSYEQATKWAPDIHRSGEMLDFVVFDEAHYLKNENTARTKALLGEDGQGYDGPALITYAERVWHLTGTPMANDPMDIYTFLKLVEAIGDMKSSAFKKQFFSARRTTYSERHDVLPDQIPLLRQLLTNNAIRRTKEEAGLQLPPIWLTSVLIDGDTSAVLALLAEHPGLEDAIINAIERGGLSFLDAQYVATLRRLIGEAKAVPYAHMVRDELDSGAGKRVIFGVHKAALKTVRDVLLRHKINAVLVNGDTPERDRVEYVRMFQEDPNCMVFLGNIRAAGTGLTLTASADLDLFESDWTPAGNAQAIMRVHRIGQTAKLVRGRFITLAKSFDEVVTRVVGEKTAAIAAVDGNAMIAAPPLT